jgi:GH25 family lysozyme M1 (1,4-beta-N-acetylmuramidase)
VIDGIDISSYQGAPDFRKVRAAGRDFVVIKLTEATNYVNPYAAQTRAAARAAGLIVGLYHFARVTDAGAEANYFCDRAGDLAAGEFLVLDWEVASADPVSWCLAFLNRVQQRTGIKPFLYINLSLNNSYNWSSVVKAGYPLWLALYDGKPDVRPATDWPAVTMKQFSETGVVDGVAGKCDVDVFYGDRSALASYGKGGNMQASQVVVDALMIQLLMNLGLFRQPNDPEVKSRGGQTFELMSRDILGSQERKNIEANIILGERARREDWEKQLADLKAQLSGKATVLDSGFYVVK